MHTLQFLELVWPAVGPYLLAIPATFTDGAGTQVKYFKHYAYNTIADAASAANALACGDGETVNGQDVFFALGSVKEDLTAMTKKQREAVGKKVRGVHKDSQHDNTQALRCFWLDIDVKADPMAYPTVKEAFEALRAFVTTQSLPKPYVVSSGGGLHVYWPMTEAIDPQQWAHYAGILKRVTKSWGLRADPMRTTDRASVLRPVGTYNWKTGTPRVVELKVAGEVTGTEQLLTKLAYLGETTGTSAPPTAARVSISTAGINDQIIASMQVQGPPSNPRRVVKRCQQLSWQAGNPDAVSEPQWYDMVGCLRHAERGSAAVHLMSKGHTQYSQSATDAKIQQHVSGDYGPTLCQTFEDHRPGGCAGCPHAGKIKTPLVLGREEITAPPPVVALAGPQGEADLPLPEAPYPFRRVTDHVTGLTKIVVRQFDSDGNDIEDEVVYEHDLHPSGITFNERDGYYYCTVRRFLPKDGWADFEFPLGKLYDRRTLAGLFGNIGVVPDSGKVELLVQYMIAYIRELQKQAAATIIYAQLGWREDGQGFVLPGQLVTAAGPEPVKISKNVLDTLTWKEPRGDLDTWKQVVAVFETPGMEGHQFGFGVGFAAPLFSMTGFTGMIVSVVGERGSGKSSVVRCANSIWGHDKMSWVDMEHDTRRAFFETLGVLRHLPPAYDEITNLDPESLSDLCYAVSKGQGRRRLNTDGTSKENFGGWQTMMLTTSNSSIHARLQLAKADATAESVRVFEYQVPPNTLPKAVADEAFAKLVDNYGLAGPIYAQFLVANREKVKSRIQHWIKVVDQRAQVTSGERFWSAGVACVLTGFEVANKLGLTNVDIRRLFDFAVAQTNKMRGTVDEGVRTPSSILADYLNGNLRNMLISNSKPERGKIMLVGREPQGELRVRYDTWADRLYIDRHHIRQFCAERRIDFRTFRDGLFLSGALLNDQTKITLGRGTAYGTAQSWCWMLDTNHPDMAGARPTLAAVPDADPSSATG